MTAQIETDYLVVGAGANGMGFVDSIVEHSDADVVIIDRRHRPGGHWLDSYPFVQLHQPSMNYGVNSMPLGQDDRIESRGTDTGFYERASGAEICGYYDDVLRHRLLASGRVRFFGMCEYLGDRRYRSLITGAETDVTARRAIVDATYMETHVPATDPPPFAVADGATCIPVGELTCRREPAAGYVVIGAGKTAMDAVCWLLDQGTPPAQIAWIRPQDAWMLNRKYFQPASGVVATFEGIVLELEAFVECDTIEAAYERFEEHELVFRIDHSVTPGMFKGATASRGEVEQMRRIENVVRFGHVERIETNEIVLEHGAIPTSPDHVHVHCATPGLSDNPPIAIFTDSTITLQPISRISLSLAAGLIGYVEASGRSTEEKNRICPPNPWPQTPFDWARHLLIGMRTETEWLGAPDVQAWVEASRLNLMKGIGEDPDHERVRALQGRFLDALGPALAKLEVFVAQATPAERARIFAPVA
jgi:hypothetical protein